MADFGVRKVCLLVGEDGEEEGSRGRAYWGISWMAEDEV